MELNEINGSVKYFAFHFHEFINFLYSIINMIRFMILLMLSTFSKQEVEFFVDVGKRITNDYIFLTCNVTFSNREFLHRIEWYKGFEILSVHHLQYLYSESRKTIWISSFLNITRNCSRNVDYENIGEYVCHTYTTKEEKPVKYKWENLTRKIDTPAEYVENNYTNLINVRLDDFKDLPKAVPVFRIVDKYKSDYWVKYYQEEEGNIAIIRCIYNNNEFSQNQNWYKSKNELIDTKTGKANIQRNYLFIYNLTMSDKNLYRCVSPNNEFYTILIVQKNYKKSKY